jgi:hypothetical protein
MKTGVRSAHGGTTGVTVGGGTLRDPSVIVFEPLENPG